MQTDNTISTKVESLEDAAMAYENGSHPITHIVANAFIAGGKFKEQQLLPIIESHGELLEALKEMYKFFKHINPDLKNTLNIQLYHNKVKPQIESAIEKANNIKP